MSTIKQNIQKNIAKIRKLNGLTQKELASKLGISSTNVSSWEQGKSSPDVDTLIEICKILNTSVVEMYGYKAPHPEQSFEGVHKYLVDINNDTFKAGSEFNSLEDDEKKLLSFYNQLNSEGKEKALEYLEDLTQLHKYKKSDFDQMVDENA